MQEKNPDHSRLLSFDLLKLRQMDDHRFTVSWILQNPDKQIPAHAQ